MFLIDLKRVLVTTIVLLSFDISIKSQRLELTNIQAPTTRDLGRYGMNSVNGYFGKANISIPLYEEDIDGFTLNIGLSYDTGGFLMNSLPGWLGHGWSSNPGGVIIRKLNGNYDEDYVTNIQRINNTIPLINYFNNNLTNNGYGDLHQIAYYQTNSDTIRDFCPDEFFFNVCGMHGRFFLDNEKNWRVQSEQNIRVVFDINDDDNYILPFVSHLFGERQASFEAPKTIKGFTLIDDNGTKYVFGGNSNSIEYSIDMDKMGYGDYRGAWKADAWYLTEVIDVHGKILCSYDYQRGKFVVQIHNSHRTNGITSKVYTNYTSFLGGTIYDVTTLSSSDNNYFPNIPYYMTLNAPVFLKSINTYTGTNVEFNLSTDSVDRLTPLPDFYEGFKTHYERIYNPHTSYEMHKELLIKWGELHSIARDGCYFYFLQHKGEEYEECWADNKRTPSYTESYLTCPLDVIEFYPLKSIVISKQGNAIQNIEFQYDREPRLHLTDVYFYGISESRMSLYDKYHLNYYNYDMLDKDYVTKKTDYWGYYNGNNNSNSSSANYKMPNINYGRCGMLKEIIYPTGGKTVLEYEQNTYSSHLNYNRDSLINDGANVEIGGLRIKKITDYNDDNTKVSERKYLYNNKNSNLSSGQALSIPIVNYAYELFYGYNGSNWWQTSISGSQEMYICTSEESVVPMSDSDGMHIGYSLVTEVMPDSTYREYYYTNYADYPDIKCVRNNLGIYSESSMTEYLKGNITPYDKFTDMGFARGKLKQSVIYNKDNSIQSDEVYIYGFLNYNNAANSNYFDLLELLNKDYAYSAPCYRIHAIQDQYYHVGGLYKLYYKPFVLLKKYTRKRNGNSFYETETMYNYIYSQDSYQLSDNGKFYKSNSVRCVEERMLCPENESNVLRTVFSYPHDGTAEYSIFNKCHFYPAIETSIYNNERLIKKESNTYSSTVTINSSMEHCNSPFLTRRSIFIGSQPKETTTFEAYYDNGALKRYSINGKHTALLWDTFGNLCAKYSYGSSISGNVTYHPDNSPFNTLQLNGLSIYESGQPVEAYVYKYDRYGRLISRTNPLGITEYYDYNIYGKLSTVKDNNLHIISRSKYNYKTTNNDLLEFSNTSTINE